LHDDPVVQALWVVSLVWNVLSNHLEVRDLHDYSRQVAGQKQGTYKQDEPKLGSKVGLYEYSDVETGQNEAEDCSLAIVDIIDLHY